MEIVPGYSFVLDVWAGDTTNTVEYNGVTSTNGVLQLTLTTPSFTDGFDIAQLLDDCTFTLGANEDWLRSLVLAYDNFGSVVSQGVMSAFNIVATKYKLAPYIYSTVDARLITLALDGAKSKDINPFTATTFYVADGESGTNVENLILFSRYEGIDPVAYPYIDFEVNGSALSTVTSIDADTTVDIVAIPKVSFTLNAGDADVFTFYNGGFDVLPLMPMLTGARDGTTLSEYLTNSQASVTKLGVDNDGWKNLSDDTEVDVNAALVDGQSVYPYWN